MTNPIDLTKKAAVVLEKFGDALFEQAEVYLVLDDSGSMSRYYNDPRQPVVHLARQVLALGLARLDPNGKIPLWLFGSGVYGPWDVTQENLYPAQGKPGRFFKSAPQDIITQAKRESSGGSTNLTDAIRAVTAEHLATGLGKPGLAVIQTDGQPDNQASAKAAFAEASKYNLFFVIIGYGIGSRRFVEECDQGGFAGQLVDNVGSFYAGEDPLALSDEDVFTALVKEVPTWRRAARGKVQGAV